ncbi:CHAT domain-containing protein [Mongoliimonas terrestris]|uniref:CHAT domain-containing protein n=1 Tax=Mongoliimonas terrestris TaxID=1709001 RepID=UPI0009496E11|nr:CHAT domain-containing protein [Mongoliimonas terrestris]
MNDETVAAKFDAERVLDFLDQMNGIRLKHELRAHIRRAPEVGLTKDGLLVLKFVLGITQRKIRRDLLLLDVALLEKSLALGVDRAMTVVERRAVANRRKLAWLVPACSAADDSGHLDDGNAIGADLVRALDRVIAGRFDRLDEDVVTLFGLRGAALLRDVAKNSRSIKEIGYAIEASRQALDLARQIAHPGLTLTTALQYVRAVVQFLKADQPQDSSHSLAVVVEALTALQDVVAECDPRDPRLTQLTALMGILSAPLAAMGASKEALDRLGPGQGDPQGPAAAGSAIGRIMRTLFMGAARAKSGEKVDGEQLLRDMEVSIETIGPSVGLDIWLQSQKGLADLKAARGSKGDAKALLLEALTTGRQLILASTSADQVTRALTALSEVAGSLVALEAGDGNAEGVFRAISLSRSVRSSVGMAMARLESDPAFLDVRKLRGDVVRLREDVAHRRRLGRTLHAEMKASPALSDPRTAAEKWAPATSFQQAFDEAVRRLEVATGTFQQALAQRELDAVLKGPDIREVCQAVPPGGVAVILAPAASRAWLLIVPHGADGLRSDHLVELDAPWGDLSTDLFDGPGPAPSWLPVFRQLRADLAEGRPVSILGPELRAFSEALDAITRRLWDGLMGPLDAALRAIGCAPDGSTEVILMPPGKLSILPLQAAWRPSDDSHDGRRLFLDDWALTICQSPQALVAAHQRLSQPARARRRALGVTDPLGDLSAGSDAFVNPGLAAFDAAERRELRGSAATRAAVLQEIGTSTHVTFYCHGVWNLEDPEASGLALAPAPGTTDPTRSDRGPSRHDLLSVHDLWRAGISLDVSRLWVLAACETGALDLSLPDEFSGLGPSLATEVPAVLSTLYPVDASTTDLAIRAFMRVHLSFGLSPARALREVQRAIRMGRDAIERLAGPDVALPAPVGGAPGVRPQTITVPLMIDETHDPASAMADADADGREHRSTDDDEHDTDAISQAWRQSYFWAAYAVAGL